MTIVDILLRGLIVGIVSSITVGPVAVLCIKRTLNKSRRSGFISGMGVACIKYGFNGHRQLNNTQIGCNMASCF